MNSFTSAAENLVSHTLDFEGERLTVHNFAADRLINETLAAHHVWEPWQLSLMHRILGEDFTCVDVGANIGINAMYMARCCPKGKVIAFEPFEAIYEVLVKNVAANGLANLTAVNKGISDAKRSMQMVTNVGMVGGAHIVERAYSGDAQHVVGDFHFAPLDEELAARGIDRVDFMKIDVEGHELQVFMGAERVLRNPDLQLIVEFNPAQLRRAISVTAALPDSQLFALLRKYFRHVLYLNRDGTMYEIRTFHELRQKLLGGYFVDDLYCTNRIPRSVAKLITKKRALSPALLIHNHRVGRVDVETVNRDLDGWALGSPFAPAVMSLTATGKRGRKLLLKLSPLHKKHIEQKEIQNWPVWAMVNDAAYSFDLMDKGAELPIQLGDGPTEITIQSEHQAPAWTYLGNPKDTRTVGFQVNFEAIE